MRIGRTVSAAFGVAVVIFLGSILAIFILALLANQARAELNRSLWQVGADLSEIEMGTGGANAPRSLLVNGTEILVRTGSRDDLLDDVLDAAAAECGARPDSMFDPALGDRDGQHGFVACFPALGKLDPIELYRLAEAFADGGDLSELGRFQYTYARATEGGTHVVEARIPSLDIGRMLPASGDAPGTDVEGIPRPAGGRRVVSAAQVGSPYQLAIYEGAEGQAAAVRASYQRVLRQSGWDVYQAPESDSTYAFRGELMAVISIREQDGGVSVAVAAGL